MVSFLGIIYLKKNKDGAYIINLDEYAHWIVSFCKKYEIVSFDSFGVEHIPNEIKDFIGHPSSSTSQNKNIKANIFFNTRTQFNNVWLLLHRIY